MRIVYLGVTEIHVQTWSNPLKAVDGCICKSRYCNKTESNIDLFAFLLKTQVVHTYQILLLLAGCGTYPHAHSPFLR